MTCAYCWELTGYGSGVLTRMSDGANVLLQGDECWEFDDQWESLETDEWRDVIASAYGDVMDAPGA